MRLRDHLLSFGIEIAILYGAHYACADMFFTNGKPLDIRFLLCLYIPMRLALGFAAHVRREESRTTPPPFIPPVTIMDRSARVEEESAP